MGKEGILEEEARIGELLGRWQAGATGFTWASTLLLPSTLGPREATHTLIGGNASIGWAAAIKNRIRRSRRWYMFHALTAADEGGDHHFILRTCCCGGSEPISEPSALLSQ